MPQPESFDEVLALLSGQELETYRIAVAQRAQLMAEAKRYVDLPPDQWPQLSFNWDLATESQRFALDGIKTSDFQRHYPNGFNLGWVRLAEFDSKLCHFSRRDGLRELWELGSKWRLAYVIAYIANGLALTPPLIRPVNEQELIIAGGHHRYSAAKAAGVESIPFYVEPANREAVERIAPVRWDDAQPPHRL